MPGRRLRLGGPARRGVLVPDDGSFARVVRFGPGVEAGVREPEVRLPVLCPLGAVARAAAARAAAARAVVVSSVGLPARVSCGPPCLVQRSCHPCVGFRVAAVEHPPYPTGRGDSFEIVQGSLT